MQETWRWFGPDDPVSLREVIQAGASGVVTSLHHIPTGEIWPVPEIIGRRREIEAHGMNWAVVESVPVHNDIKTRSGDYRRLIDNYKQTLRHLGEAGIEVVCYNFMPVVDWTRTNLSYTLPNGARALRFEMTDFAAYDVYAATGRCRGGLRPGSAGWARSVSKPCPRPSAIYWKAMSSLVCPGRGLI